MFVWLESSILLLGVSKPFDVIENPVSTEDASLDFVHVVFLIFFDITYFQEDFGEIGYRAVSGYKWH